MQEVVEVVMVQTVVVLVDLEEVVTVVALEEETEVQTLEVVVELKETTRFRVDRVDQVVRVSTHQTSAVFRRTFSKRLPTPQL